MESAVLENDGANSTQEYINDRTGRKAVCADRFSPGPVISPAVLLGPSFSTLEFSTTSGWR